MKDVLDKFVNGHPGTYCLDVLFGNLEARAYWFRRFKELGYVEIFLPFIEHGVTGICETLYFTEGR